MSAQNLLFYLVAAFILAITPGPGIFYVAARTLAGGRAEGIASSLGNGLGGMVHVVLGALGVSALVLASATFFTALKICGAFYLIWLGIRAIREAGANGRLDLGIDQTGGVGAQKAFREGVLVEAANPKTAAFFLAFIPQFVDPAAGPVALQFLVLGLVSVALNVGADMSVAFAAARLRDRALGNPSLIVRLRQLSGGAMIFLGLGLLMARRPAL